MAPKHPGDRARRVRARKVDRRGNSILLSLKPGFARLIFDGRKTIELRRIAPRRQPRLAFVYETAPSGRVAGFSRSISVQGLRTEAWS